MRVGARGNAIVKSVGRTLGYLGKSSTLLPMRRSVKHRAFARHTVGSLQGKVPVSAPGGHLPGTHTSRMNAGNILDSHRRYHLHA